MVQFEEEQIVKTTRVGLVMNVLTQMIKIDSKSEFLLSLLRGFASNFSKKYRIEIAKQIF